MRSKGSGRYSSCSDDCSDDESADESSEDDDTLIYMFVKSGICAKDSINFPVKKLSCSLTMEKALKETTGTCKWRRVLLGATMGADITNLVREERLGELQLFEHEYQRSMGLAPTERSILVTVHQCKDGKCGEPGSCPVKTSRRHKGSRGSSKKKKSPPPSQFNSDSSSSSEFSDTSSPPTSKRKKRQTVARSKIRIDSERVSSRHVGRRHSGKKKSTPRSENHDSESSSSNEDSDTSTTLQRKKRQTKNLARSKKEEDGQHISRKSKEKPHRDANLYRRRPQHRSSPPLQGTEWFNRLQEKENRKKQTKKRQTIDHGGDLGWGTASSTTSSKSKTRHGSRGGQIPVLSENSYASNRSLAAEKRRKDADKRERFADMPEMVTTTKMPPRVGTSSSRQEKDITPALDFGNQGGPSSRETREDGPSSQRSRETKGLEDTNDSQATLSEAEVYAQAGRSSRCPYAQATSQTIEDISP